MIGGMVKKLIIVTGEKESIYAELLSSLITLKDDDAENNAVVGIKDGSVEAVVIPTEKATSPLQRNDIMLLETPPGQQPTKIIPAVR